MNVLRRLWVEPAATTDRHLDAPLRRWQEAMPPDVHSTRKDRASVPASIRAQLTPDRKSHMPPGGKCQNTLVGNCGRGHSCRATFLAASIPDPNPRCCRLAIAVHKQCRHRIRSAAPYPAPGKDRKSVV